MNYSTFYCLNHNKAVNGRYFVFSFRMFGTRLVCYVLIRNIIATIFLLLLDTLFGQTIFNHRHHFENLVSGT